MTPDRDGALTVEQAVHEAAVARCDLTAAVDAATAASRYRKGGAHRRVDEAESARDLAVRRLSQALRAAAPTLTERELSTATHAAEADHDDRPCHLCAVTS